MIRIACFILMMMVSLAGQAKKQKQLVILHTNDTHSAIFPINEQLPDTMKAGRGGFLRRIAMLKRNARRIPTCCISIVAISSRAQPISPCSRAMSR